MISFSASVFLWKNGEIIKREIGGNFEYYYLVLCIGTFLQSTSKLYSSLKITI